MNEIEPATIAYKNRHRRPLAEVFDAIESSGHSGRTSVADVVKSLRRRSFAPLILVPGLLALSPLSGIVGMSTLCGLWIALVSGQLLLHREHLWLPEFLLRRELAQSQIKATLDWLRPSADWVDRHAHKRWIWLLRFPFSYIAALACFAIGCSMPFLELVPFSGSLAGLAVSLLALGILLDDGLVVVVGLAVAAGGATLLATIGTTIAGWLFG